MCKISYTYTNKAKIVMYLMLVAAGILRLVLVTEIKVYDIEGYEVYLLPTYLYYFVLFAILTGIFFGYKFFYSLFDENMITYCNVLFNRSKSMAMNDIKFADFGRKGVALYDHINPEKGEQPTLYLPFFRLGIPEAISVNNFFERLIDKKGVVVKKRFEILPGYSKLWSILSLIYAFISFCIMIVCLQPLYTVIILYMSHH